MAQRGRPKSVNIEPNPRVFTREYRDEYGAQTWYFDLDKNPYGPIRVDNMDVIQAREELGELPLSKQKHQVLNKVKIMQSPTQDRVVKIKIYECK